MLYVGVRDLTYLLEEIPKSNQRTEWDTNYVMGREGIVEQVDRLGVSRLLLGKLDVVVNEWNSTRDEFGYQRTGIKKNNIKIRKIN